MLSFSFLITVPAHAATVVPSVTKVSVVVGHTLLVRYRIDPGAQRDYTAKLVFTFPSGILSLTSFQFADGWLGLPEPGYDAIDNVGGTFIKTGGYPRGIGAPMAFGTATFKVVGSGTGVIALSGGSFIHSATHQDVLEDASGTLTRVTSTGARVPSAAPVSTSTTGQNLFDVSLGVASTTAQGARWISWLIVILSALIALILTLLRKRLLKKRR